MPLAAGFYALEKSLYYRRLVARSRQTLSVLGFLRALRHGTPLPQEVLVTGLDRMLYQVYRLHGEGQGGRQAVRRAVNALGRALYNARARNRLLTNAPVVHFALEYVEHSEHWRAGVRIRPSNEPLELLGLEQFRPHCQVVEVGGESVCHSPF